jgi:hypothetical protein
MAMRYPGGLIATSPVNAAYPSGVWTQSQTIPYASQNVWQRDQYWPYTTLLLQGNGTNGAQNNTFLDSSSNNFSITRNGNTTQGSFTPYEANGYWSNYFDPSGDYLTATKNAAYEIGSGDFTVEAWIFPTEGGSLYNSGVFSYGASSSLNGYLFGITGSNAGGTLNRIMFEYNYDGTLYTSTSGVTLNAWNHIAVSRSGSNIYVFLNGNLQSTTSTSKTANTNAGDVSVIGSESYDPGSTNRNFRGYISNLRLVKGTAVYTSSFTPSAAPLTAITNTSLLTCQSNRFIDNSTNAFAITRNGDTSVQAFQPFPGATTWSASVLGGSGYFDGSGDYLSITTASSDFSLDGDFTIEFYANPETQTNNYPSIISCASAWSAGAFYVRYSDIQGINRFGVFLNPADPLIMASTTSAVGAWHHVAVTRSGSTITLWVNGANVGTATNSSTINLALGGGVWIGNNGSASCFYKGGVSNLRVVKGAAVYTAAFTPPTSPVTAISGTSLLLNFTNAGIFDSAMMNDLETVGNAQVSTSIVKYGTGSMAFDGSGDYLRYLGTVTAGLGSGNFTIEFWINAPSLNDKFILGLRGGMSGGPHVTTGGYGGTTVGALRWASNAGEILSGTTLITDNTWHHCAIVRNGSTITLYVDGISRGSGTDTTSFDGNGGQIPIGYNNAGAGNDFNGYLDDLRITKGAARYISNFTPPPARMPQQ